MCEDKESAVRETSSTFQDVPIIPVLTFHHVYGKPGTKLMEPVVKTVTVVNAADCPADLAKAFLGFVSQGTAEYTKEELHIVGQVIQDIHQRHYAKL